MGVSGAPKRCRASCVSAAWAARRAVWRRIVWAIARGVWGAADGHLRRIPSWPPSALLTQDGTIHSLNAPMAATLGRPAQQCVGYDFLDLLPETQRASAESLLIHGATTKTVVPGYWRVSPAGSMSTGNGALIRVVAPARAVVVSTYRPACSSLTISRGAGSNSRRQKCGIAASA